MAPLLGIGCTTIPKSRHPYRGLRLGNRHKHIDSRITIIEPLARGRMTVALIHPIFKPLTSLSEDLAAILVVERFWLEESETRNDPEYIPEAFQRLILQFMLENRDEEFMTTTVEHEFRRVEEISQNASLSATQSFLMDAENSRKRRSPLPPQQRKKRPRTAGQNSKVPEVGCRCKSLNCLCSYTNTCFQYSSDETSSGEEEVSTD